MEPFPGSDDWLLGPLAGHAPVHDGGEATGVDGAHLDVLDDLFTLLIESPPPGTAVARGEDDGATAEQTSAPALPAALAPSPSQLAVAAASPGSSSGQSAQEEDGGGASPPSNGSANGSADPVEAAASQPVRKKKRRKRPKDELDYLRSTVAALEQELSALRTPESPPSSAVASDPGQEEDDAEWQQIALHQRQEAESAHATNAQLRSMLEGQLAVAQQLQQALQQHLKMARMEGMDAASSSGPTLSGELASPELFAEMDAKLEVLYRRVGAVLAATNFAPGTGKEPTQSSANKTSDRGTYFEISNEHRLPFPVAAVNRALWRANTLTDSNMVRGWVRRIDDDTFRFGFSEPFISAHMPSVTFTVKSSIRRYFEQERIVTVWSSVIEIEGSMYVRLREDGWGIVTPAVPLSTSSKKSESATEVSTMQNVVHVTPEVANMASAEEQRAHVGEMTDLVLSTYRRLVHKVNQTVENLLVAESISGAS